MISDVPLGAFLSGGVDSSTVVALMQTQSSIPVRSFSIGFENARFNEANDAAAVARHLGTDHTELYVTEEDALNVVPQLPKIFDEPFADSSQIPSLLLSRLTRKHVTVAMSGDGGDEIFGGYNRYILGPQLWKKVAWLPIPLRRALGAMIGHLPALPFSILAHMVGSALKNAGHSPNLEFKLAGIAHKLRHAKTIDDLYVLLVSEWETPFGIVKGSNLTATILDERESWPQLRRPESRMMALDALTYLPDDILVKVDRSSMAPSLEARAPFLDARVVEFASRLPFDMKISGKTGKRILRKVLYRYVPQNLVERPKQGFGIPLDDWLRGALRNWGEDLLSEKRLESEGYFDPKPIRAAWQSHLSGERQYGYRLWSVLMFQAWLQESR
jgi:asparagine synthase (glutamine-hydrolysing)